MDVERSLKNIGDWISKETESRKYPKGELLELSESLQALKAEIAHQSIASAVCPDCNGSGVYQEYDEYDRYTVHDCGRCDGSGEITRQSVTDDIDDFGLHSSSIEHNVVIDTVDGANQFVNALEKASRQPTDEVVRDAIEWMSGVRWSADTRTKQRVEAILTALRQMRTEPCEDTYSQCEECGQAYLDNRGYDYCPNCGIKLVTE